MTNRGGVAIDPGKHEVHLAWAVGDAVLCASLPTRAEIMQGFLKQLHRLGYVAVVCESPFCGRNRKTYAELFHVVESLRSAASRAGLKFITVAPRQWQKAVLRMPSDKGKKETQRSVVMKARSRIFARRVMGGYDLKRQDHCDAICILWSYEERLLADSVYDRLCEQQKGTI